MSKPGIGRSRIHRQVPGIVWIAVWVGTASALTAITGAAEPPITALAFAPSASRLLVGSQEGVIHYSWPELKSPRTIDTKLSRVHHIAFSPDGKMVALAGGTSGEKGRVEFWSWPQGKPFRSDTIHSDLIYDLAWSADSKWLFTASHDGTVKQLSANTGEILQTLAGHSGPVTSVGLLADQKTLVSAGTDQTIRVWDITTGQVVRSLNNHTKPIRQLAVRPSSDSKTLPMIATIAADRTLRVWQPTIGRMVRFLRLESAQPSALAWSSDGKSLFLTDDTGQLQHIDSDTLEIQATTKTGVERPISLALDNKGSAVVVGGDNGQIRTLSHPKNRNP